LDNLRKRNIIVMGDAICVRPLESPLFICFCIVWLLQVVEYDPAFVWDGVGNAAIGERYVPIGRGKREPNVDIDLANGSIVFDVVCMEGTKCTLF